MHQLLLSLWVVCATAHVPDVPAEPPTFPVPTDAEAWGKLPPRKTPNLPEWARALAEPLPKTAAKLLELDHLHRANSPLGARLSARLRAEVADALNSTYGAEIARADLKRALPDTGRPGLTKGDTSSTAPAERAAVAFARKLTLAGHAITDDEFAALLKHFSPADVTAIVHTVAFANFHNRLILGLGVRGESPIAEPVPGPFDLGSAQFKAPARPPWSDLKRAKGDGIAVRVEWSAKEFDALTSALEKQKDRKLRVPLPDRSRFEKLAPREREQAEKILWNTISSGYQPELTRAWFAPLSTFYEEAKVDRIFTNSMFWVVTRTNDCFY